MKPGSDPGVELIRTLVLLAVVYPLLFFWDPRFLESFFGHFEPLLDGDHVLLHAIALAGVPVLALVLAIAVHEVGHVVGGVCAGFRFNQLRIGPLQIDRPFRVSLQRGRGLGYAGWAALDPEKVDRLVARAAVLVIAGPAINLISAAAIFTFAQSRSYFVWSFFFASLVLGVRELLPLPHRIAISDGRRLWLLVHNPPWKKRWAALLRLGAEIRSGVMPEAWSLDDIADAMAYLDESPDTVTAHGTGYASALYRGLDVDAGRCLEIALSHSGATAPAQRHALASDAGVFQARRRKRPDIAEIWLSLIPESSELQWLRTRIEVAILEARGDFDGALIKLDELEERIRVLPSSGYRAMWLQLLDRWRSELRAPRVAPPPQSIA